MTHFDASPDTPPVRRGVVIESFGPANRRAVMELAARAWDRSRTAAILEWRYERCPNLEAVVALAGDECVAMLFAMRRTYWTSTGNIECLELFDWFTTEPWRPLGTGLRLIKRLMAGPRPLIALGGASAAQGLLKRLGWHQLSIAERWVLPLTGRFLERRGWPAPIGRAFDLVGGRYFAPARRRPGSLRVEPAGTPGPALSSIVERQRRFAIVPRQDPRLLLWLRDAPVEAGLYLGFNLIVSDTMVGWAWARVLTVGGIRIADVQDVFLADEAREFYPEAMHRIARILAGFEVDAVYSTTSCPETLAALKRCRFRLDETLPSYAWRKGALPDGPALITGSHAEFAFFPAATAAEAAWVTQR